MWDELVVKRMRETRDRIKGEDGEEEKGEREESEKGLRWS